VSAAPHPENPDAGVSERSAPFETRQAGTRGEAAAADAHGATRRDFERSAAHTAGRVALPPPELILVRYGEISLKGGNRAQFESALARNIRAALRNLSSVEIERRQGRFVVVPKQRGEEVARRLRDVFGIKSVSPAWGVAADRDAIADLGRQVLAEALDARARDRTITVRIESKRADKTFPMTSNQLDRFVADRALAGLTGVRVKLDDPELTLGIELRSERAYVFVERFPGPGGLPVGTLGRALCLLSGGIDSPVAAWLAMKRGLAVSHVTFHSYPFIGDASKLKVIEVARALVRYQPSNRLYVVPFAETQTAIRDTAPEGYRTVLYRRMMQRISSRIAAKYELDALVTGDCLGQVASQTLENMTCIGEAAEIPILRPLLTYDKDETIALARKIGTFDISNVQEPDCCSLFMPSHPVLRGKLEICRGVESKMDVERLIARGIEGVEIHDLAED
jgi:thiamine biosynthesis protein ThiI